MLASRALNSHNVSQDDDDDDDYDNFGDGHSDGHDYGDDDGDDVDEQSTPQEPCLLFMESMEIVISISIIFRL